MTDVKKLVKDASLRLNLSDSPLTDAYEIARRVFGLTKTEILIEPLREISENDILEFNKLIEKRAGGYPLQYIAGEWDFFGLTFYVNEGVLIPRPETEHIADEACEFLKGKKDLTVFDLCSGTGCIGLSAAFYNRSAKIYLFDIEEAALECSKKNKNRYSLDNVFILNYNVLKGFNGDILPVPDVILCNPPYVSENEYYGLEREIFYEPKAAIVGGSDGLMFHRAVIEKWLPYLNKNGFFMLECGENQSKKVLSYLEPFKPRFDIKTEFDLYGMERFVLGRRIA